MRELRCLFSTNQRNTGNHRRKQYPQNNAVSHGQEESGNGVSNKRYLQNPPKNQHLIMLLAGRKCEQPSTHSLQRAPGQQIHPTEDQQPQKSQFNQYLEVAIVRRTEFSSHAYVHHWEAVHTIADGSLEDRAEATPPDGRTAILVRSIHVVVATQL